MTYKNILVEKEEGIAIITYNRPEKLNAFNKDLYLEVKAALEEFRKDENVRSIIITGAGKAFSAGADLDILGELTLARFEEFVKLEIDILELINNLDKLVIAAVNGYAMGYACMQALSCDIVLASQKAKFAYSEINVGLPNFPHLINMIATAKAKELLLTGRTIDAIEAERIGLICRVVEDNDLMREAKKLAKNMSKIAPLAFKYTKKAINSSPISGAGYTTWSTLGYATACFLSDDFKEVVAAFQEKRSPKFKGC